MCSNLNYMQGVKSIKDIDVAAKRVLIRVDFNIPVDSNNNITDDRRIREAIPTIKYCIENKASLITLVSHFGQPKAVYNNKYSLKNIANRLVELLDKNVSFIEDLEYYKNNLQNYSNGEIFLLENIRFNDGEKKNDSDLSKKLASICDIYVNDAFGASHRKHSSTYGIADYAKTKVAGFLMIKEIEAFSKALEHPISPVTLVVGGSKVSTKIGLLKAIMKKIDKLIIGGAMSNTFLKAIGYEIGDSMYEPKFIDVALDVIEEARLNGVKLYLPVDVVITNSIQTPTDVRVVSSHEILEGFQAVDIGPATIELFSDAISKSKTIIWNGPMGIYENEKYSNGTFKIADAIANSGAYTIVGGGDTADAVERLSKTDNFSFISTGGGASLELLEGKILPGFSHLDRLREAN